MLLFVYLVVVIFSISKQRKKGRVVSGWTRFIVYSLFVLSLIYLLAGVLAFSLIMNPLVGFYYVGVIGIMVEIIFFVNMVIAFGLMLLSVSIYLDSKRNQESTPLLHHLLRLGVHILLIIYIF